MEPSNRSTSPRWEQHSRDPASALSFSEDYHYLLTSIAGDNSVAVYDVNQETGLIKRGSLRLYIEAENILNTPYFDFGGLPMPGLWLNGGLMVRL